MIFHIRWDNLFVYLSYWISWSCILVSILCMITFNSKYIPIKTTTEIVTFLIMLAVCYLNIFVMEKLTMNFTNARQFFESLPPAPSLTLQERVQQEVERFNAKEGEMTDDIDCPICKNKQLIYVPDKNGTSVMSRECECKKRHESLRLARQSGMNALLKCTFEGFKATEPWQIRMLTTGMPVSEARCILAESIESMTSRWLMRMSSSFIDCKCWLTKTQVGNSLHHSVKCWSSFSPRPKRKMRALGCLRVNWRMTSCINGVG